MIYTYSTRFKLLNYVCGQSCLKPSPLEGWATLNQVFVYRPDKCRYAITLDTDGGYAGWDFFEDQLIHTLAAIAPGQLVPLPPPRWTGETAEGVTMTVMMNYDVDPVS